METKCPIGREICEGCEYAKEENLCDYPYRNGLTLEEIRKITEKELEIREQRIKGANTETL